VANARKKRLFEHIARLRRAERHARDSRDIVAVRAALEEDFGHTVSRALAAELLGVSHTGLQRWVERGDVPIVLTPRGRREVPLAALLDLYEAVEAERRSGRRHVLEPGIVEGHRRAERLRPRDLVEEAGDTDGHRRAELRSLAYHRALAKRLRRGMADDALRLVWQWRETGQMDDHYANLWEDILRRPLPEIREAITADDQRGRDLRQNSPFAGVLSEPERRRILTEIR
jgi:hypothetical protein